MTSIFRIFGILAMALVLGGLGTQARAQAFLSQAFSPNSVGPGGTSTVIYTIQNSGSTPLRDVSFTNTLPTTPGAMTIADPSGAHTCSGGILSAPVAGGTISFSDGKLGAGSSCEITVNVTAPVAGTYTNGPITLNSSGGSSASFPVDLTVSSSLPSFSKSFSPSQIDLFEPSRLTFLIDNTANGSAETFLSFSDTLPAALRLASPANVSTNCGAIAGARNISAPDGGTTVSFSYFGGGANPGVAASATCTFSVDVIGRAVGSHVNQSGELELSGGRTAGKATATLTVTNPGSLLISKDFSDDPMSPGGSTTLDFLISNLDRGAGATGVAFTDDLDAMLSGAVATSLVNNCGGSFTGTDTLELIAGTIAAGATCTLSATVQVPGSATAGTYPNTTSTVSGIINGTPVTGNDATANLNIVAGLPPLFSKSFTNNPIDAGDIATLVFAIENPNAFAGYTDIAFTQPLGGLVSGATLASSSNTCNATVSEEFIFPTFPPAGVQAGVSGGTLAGGTSCTVTLNIQIPVSAADGSYPSESGELTATVGASTVSGGTATATLRINARAGSDIVLIKAFANGTKLEGETVDVTFSLSRPGDAPTTDISFSDNLETFYSGTTLEQVVSNGCNGTVGGLSTSTMTFSGGQTPLTGACEIVVTLRLGSSGVGTFTNQTSVVTANQDSTGAAPKPNTQASDQIEIVADGSAPLTIAKAFLTDQLVPGATSILKFTISNPNGATTGTITSFTDNLSAALSGLAATGSPTFDDCGGSMSGTTSLSYSGGSVAGATSCTIDVEVQVPGGADAGTYTNFTSQLSSDVGGARTSAAASAAFEVVEDPVSVTKSFLDDPVAPGGTAALEFTVTNGMTSAGATNISFSDDLDAMLSGATFQGGSNTCGLMTSSAPGDPDFVTGPFSLGANSACTITINVAVPTGPAAAGTHPNTTSIPVATVQGQTISGEPATDSLQVFAASAPTFTKSFDGPAILGGSAVLTFTIVNNDATNPISDLRFSDNLGAMLSGVTASGLPSNPCGAGSVIAGSSTLTLTQGAIPAGGTCTFDVTVNVPGSATPGSHGNTTSSLTQGAAIVAGPATATFIVVPPVGFSKAFSKAAAAQGETLTMTLTLDNSGATIAATSAAVTDNFPAGLVISSVPVTAGCAGGTFNGAVGGTTVSLSNVGIAAGAVCVVTTGVRVTGASDLVNTTGDLTSDFGNSGTASDSLTVTAASDLVFSKSFSSATAAQGQTLTMDIAVNNPNAFQEATSVAFSDTFPAGLEISTLADGSAGCTGGTITGAVGTNLVSYSGGEVGPAATCTITVGVLVTGASNLTNTTSALTSSLGTTAAASDSLTVTPADVLGLNKAFSSPTAEEGQTLTLTVDISNGNAFQDSDGISFSDTFPAGLVILTAASQSVDCDGGTLTGAVGATSLAYSGGALDAGKTCTITAGVTVNGSVDFSNTISDLTSSLGNSAGSTANVSVTGAPALALMKTFSANSAAQGQSLTLSVELANASNFLSATSVGFSDIFPAGLEIFGAPSLSTGCAGGTFTGAIGATSLSYGGGTIAPNATCTIAVGVTVTDGTNISNTISDATSSLGASAASTANITVSPANVLGLNKTFSAPNATQGQTLTLAIQISNGNIYAAANDVSFSDTFPAGLELATAPIGSAGCGGSAVSGTVGSNFLSLSGGSIAPDTTCTISADVMVTGPDDIENTISDLTSDLGASGPATGNITVTRGTALGLSKSFSENSVAQGQNLTMTLMLENANTFLGATSVSFTDTFPAGLTILTPPSASAECLGGTVVGTAGTSTVSYSGGAIDVGQTCTITAGVTVTGSDNLTNTISDLTSSIGNSLAASASLTVAGAGPLGLDKAFSQSSATQGESLSMSVTIINGNPSATATSVSFADDFAAQGSGLEISTAAIATPECSGGTISGGIGDTALSWAGGSVAAGQSCVITVGVTVTDDSDIENSIVNLTSSLGDSNGSSANLTVTPASTLGLSKTFSKTTAEMGEALTMTLELTNTNAFLNATQVGFTDNMSALGLQISTAAAGSAACSAGTLSGAVGASMVSFTGGEIAVGNTCTITVGLTVTGDTSLTNTVNDLTSSLGASASASANLAVTGTSPLGLEKTFSSTTAEQGEALTMVVEITNRNGFVDAAGVSFSDDLAALGLEISTGVSGSAQCASGTLGGSVGDAAISWTGGTVAAGEVCTISVGVTVAGDTSLTNTITDLTSSLGASSSASANLVVTGAAPLGLEKAFDAPTIEQGGALAMTITLTNANSFVDASGVSFTDDMTALGLEVSTAVAGSAACSAGTLSGAVGDTVVSWTGGTIVAGDVCTLTVGVTANNETDLTNTISDLTSSLGNSTPASANLTVTAASALGLEKTFSAASADQGQSLTMTVAINNTNAFLDGTAVSFSDDLAPLGLMISTGATGSSQCGGGNISGAAGATSLAWSGGTVAFGDTCTISVGVTVTGSTDLTNTIGNLTSSLGASAADSANLAVTGAAPLTFTKAFSTGSATEGDTISLSLSLTNTSGFIDATSVSFTDGFPVGMELASAPATTAGCGGGTVGGTIGGDTVSYGAGTVLAGATCTISANVLLTGSGSMTNLTGDLTSSLGNSGTASATVVVAAATKGTVTIVQNTDTDGTFTFTSPEPSLSFTISTAGGSGRQGPISLPAGSYLVSQSRPTGVGNVDLSCTDADSSGVAATGALTLNLSILENVTCTFTSVKSDQITIDAINRFLTRRADLILANQPDFSRRIDRLNRGFGTATQLTFTNGDLVSMAPFTFNPTSLGSGDYRFSSSLSQVERAATSVALAHGDLDGKAFVDNRRFDAWVELSYQKFDDNASNEGHFGMAYLGADYLLNQDVLVGAVLQIDDMEDADSAKNSTVRGTGWMFGPYVTARLAPSLYFDARLAYGTSSNEISPFNTYTDTFNTNRWLATASLSGEFKEGPWTIRPNASLSYFEETQKAYTDGIGAAIPSQTIALGQIKVGPTISGQFETENGVMYQPSITLDGIYNFGDTRGVSITNPNTTHTNGLRGRLKAGVNFTNQLGTTFGISGIYDGIGRDDFESFGLSLELNIPFKKLKAR